uniref:F-box protein At4g00755-like n=2 Tax=Opuntia streptacantha TaxID=393608 RepID=A0A7C8ZF47_OPUST
MDHKAYSFLACSLTSSVTEDCIEVAMSASSTDNYPEESIENTLEASNRIEQRASYWSSKGEMDPAVPESLVYKLSANLCVISGIHIQPFQAYFQFGFPIYSAKAVRFHMGHLKSPFDMERDLLESASTQRFSDDMFVWTYTSPEFPMAQVNDTQKFHLPKPVLCIGGILKIELLGRVQRQEMDGLYYICMSHVQAVGQSLSPALDVDILDQTGKCSLKYHPEADYYASKEKGLPGSSTLQSISSTLVQRSVRSWEHIILNALLANGVLPDYEDLDDDNLIAYY